nr:hypothetical protein [Tanacetum cinerariifolium]
TNITRVGKGFSKVEIPLFESKLVEQQVDKEGDADENVKEVNAGDVAKGDVSADHGEVPTVAEEPSIPSLTPPTPTPQPPQDIPLTSHVQPTPPQSPQVQPPLPQPKPQPQQPQDAKFPMNLLQEERMIAKVDADADVVMKDVKEAADEAKEVSEDAKEDETEPAKVQEVVEVVTTPKLITEVVTAVNETVTAASAIITTAEAQVPAATLTTAPDEQYARELHAELNKNIDWDEVIDHVKIKAKEDPTVKKYQALKRKPQTEAQAKKNMMLYLKNVVGFKMDYFKGMSYDNIRPIFKAKFNSNVAFLLKTKEQIEEEKNRALQKLNETAVKSS